MVPPMIVYDMATKVLDTESFPQDNIAGLISGATIYLNLFSQLLMEGQLMKIQVYIYG